MCRILHLAAAAAIIDSSGQEAFFWLADLEAADRQLPVAPRKLWLQGRLWRGDYYLDLRPVFGDASLVHKFTRISNLVAWLWRHRLHEPGPTSAAFGAGLARQTSPASRRRPSHPLLGHDVHGRHRRRVRLARAGERRPRHSTRPPREDGPSGVTQQGLSTGQDAARPSAANSTSIP